MFYFQRLGLENPEIATNQKNIFTKSMTSKIPTTTNHLLEPQVQLN